jgi:hypothetical protein
MADTQKIRTADVLKRELINRQNFYNFSYHIFFINKTEGITMSRKVEVAGIMGPVWFIGWLFSLGFLKLSFFQGLLALIIWPYYIGDFVSKIIGQ